MRKRPTLLVILDGWGLRDEVAYNAIAQARTPVWDALWSGAPATKLSASGLDVGLPAGQMGNSEVGHMSIGAGRAVPQDLTRIDQAIASGTLASNPGLREIIDSGAATLHVLGLLSPGGVHSHEEHIAQVLATLSERSSMRIRLHAFLDGRDMPPKSAIASLRRFEEGFPGVLASIAGRYFAMDRDQRWDRTERAYNLLVHGQAPYHYDTAVAALEAAYERGESDEFVQPSAVHAASQQPATLAPGDAGLFMNFRADRARQLTRALLADDFDDFPRRKRVPLAAFATLTRYADDIDAPALFGPLDLKDTLGEILARRGKSQLRLAETEKYAHVTYFFSGGREQPFVGEDRILVPSPKVATYDLAPAMSAHAVTDRLSDALHAGRHDFIVCNYANGDMVGHSGDFDAAVKAVEVVDACLGRITAGVAAVGAQCLITADHGNVERMREPLSGDPHTAHTTDAVPLVYVGPAALDLHPGTLADVAPTLLELMGISPPAAMTGRSLVVADRTEDSRQKDRAAVAASHEP
ncbi:MAG: 2,3-bisphosphoglycerate-independent phosphoglycerate mutase [Gammaproteobacteria bacterium]|nr:2,3-bisphosphoglycerate-independent phosphoglycerate mutase [Gammaproteobacteria bacterium]